jgi:hypothetical protein
MKFGGDQSDVGNGFPPPEGKCQGCGNNSTWRMIKIARQGQTWKAAYPHNVLMGWQSGSEPNWKRIELRTGLQHEGWLEYCSECEPMPNRPTPSTLTAEDIAEHAGATLESVKKMLAEAQTKELPYNKYQRGEIV